MAAKTGAEANSCPLRMSRALNKNGFDINPNLLPNAEYWTGAGGKSYMMRVADMQKYLTIVLGQPDIAKVRGKNVSGWHDATGHMTLFNGNTCAHDCYFSKISMSKVRPKTRQRRSCFGSLNSKLSLYVYCKIFSNWVIGRCQLVLLKFTLG
jgi:hypothetical protein